MNVVLGDLRTCLEGLAEQIVERNPRRIYVDVPPEHSVAANRVVFNALGGRLATATGVDFRDRIDVLYHYCIDAKGVVVTLRTWAWKPEVELDSVASFLPGAQFIEREIQDLLGVKFRNHPDPRRLILADDWPEGVYPLRRELPARVAGESIPAEMPAQEPENTTEEAPRP